MPPVPDGRAPAPLHLTIVVPAFNEAHRLGAGMERLEAAAASGAVDLDRTEVVVVDDGSTDATAAVATKLLSAVPHHRVIRIPANRGKGAAVRSGIAASRATHTAYMDADMAIDPMAVSLLLEGLDGHDIAIGSRALPDSMVETTYVVRSLMGRLFNEVVTTGTGLGLQDTQCGFKAFRTPVARLLFHLVQIDRFAFDVELLVRARRLGLAVTEVPVQWKHVHGSTVHPLHDSVRMVADVVRSRRGLLAGPPVPALTVRTPEPAVADEPAVTPEPAVAARMARILGSVLDGVPVPVLAGGARRAGSTALLAMVEPADVARAHTALRQELAPLDVVRQALSFTDLLSFGPLADRLDAAPPGLEGT